MYKLNPLTSIEDVNTQIKTFYIDNSSNATQIILRGGFLNKSGRFPSIKNHSNSSCTEVHSNKISCFINEEYKFFKAEFNEIKPEEDKLPSNSLQSKKQSLKVIIQNLQLTSITNQNQIETSVEHLQMDKIFSIMKKMSPEEEQICQIIGEKKSTETRLLFGEMMTIIKATW